MKRKAIDDVFRQFNSNAFKSELIIEECSDMRCGLPLIQDEYGLACTRCGKIVKIFSDTTLDSSCVNGFQPRKLKQKYKRQIHFKKILFNLQGRELFHMRHFDKIKSYLEENQITDYSTDSIKNVLRDIGLSSYFLHIQLVRRYLGCKMEIMDDKLMDNLLTLFAQVEEQLPNLNFPNYHFLLKQLLVYLGDYERFAPLLKVLKSEGKLIKHART